MHLVTPIDWFNVRQHNNGSKDAAAKQNYWLTMANENTMHNSQSGICRNNCRGYNGIPTSSTYMLLLQ
jgi:hypothetical protein